MSLKTKYSAENPANRVRPGWVFTCAHLAHLLALFFGAGCLRPAPGTWGTLAGVMVWAAAVQIFPLKFLLVAILVGFFLGVWAAQKTGKTWGWKTRAASLLTKSLPFGSCACGSRRTG